MSALNEEAMETTYQQLLAGRTPQPGATIPIRGEFCKRCRKSKTMAGLCERCARLDIAEGLQWLAEEHLSGRIPREDVQAGFNMMMLVGAVWLPEGLDCAIGRAKHGIAQRHVWFAQKAATRVDYKRSHPHVCLVCEATCKTERGLALHVAKSASHARIAARQATT